ncbi:MAG TPA: hypothetical protein VFM02_01725 [Candidatus Paceibacterota bacterium]|nr:hypothetical protein [Candidatus Paceibacterota bacterium]
MNTHKKPSKKNFLPFLLFASLFTPFFAFAIDFTGLVDNLLGMIGAVIPLLIALSVVAFFWGIAKYLFSAGDPKARTEGGKYMLYGIIAIFVMISIWGLVAIIQYSVFGPAGSTYSTLPQIPDF